MNEALKREFKYFVDNHEAIVEKYNGKFVVIRDMEILGAYEDEDEALGETTKTHAIGTFIIQKCEPGEESYTQRFHSRVTFA